MFERLSVAIALVVVGLAAACRATPALTESHAPSTDAAAVADEPAPADGPARKTSPGPSGLGQPIVVQVPDAEPRPDDPFHLVVYVRKDGITVSGAGMTEVDVPFDHDALLEVVIEAKRQHPNASRVAVDAADDVLLQDVVDLLDTLRGDCDASSEGPDCLFPHAVLQAH